MSGVETASVVHPGGRAFTVYRSLNDIHVLTASDDLEGGKVVSGFRCRMGVFALWLSS